LPSLSMAARTLGMMLSLLLTSLSLSMYWLQILQQALGDVLLLVHAVHIYDIRHVSGEYLRVHLLQSGGVGRPWCCTPSSPVTSMR
jgi:hypothetical protein